MAERRAWVTALSEIEKLDNLPHWMATNEPEEAVARAQVIGLDITRQLENIIRESPRFSG